MSMTLRDFIELAKNDDYLDLPILFLAEVHGREAIFEVDGVDEASDGFTGVNLKEVPLWRTYSEEDQETLATLMFEEIHDDVRSLAHERLDDITSRKELDDMLNPDMDDVFVNEATDARAHGQSFQPNTELYGRNIHIFPANNEPADNSYIEGVLKSIDGPHDYTITVGGEDQQWTVDAVDDLTIEDDHLSLWNAWRP